MMYSARCSLDISTSQSAVRVWLATVLAPPSPNFFTSLRRNLLINAQVLLNFGYPREKVINLFREARITLTQLFEPFNPAVDHRNL
jgi:hypothetical protein